MASTDPYRRLPTEGVNPRAARLDRLAPLAAARLMDREDRRVFQAVAKAAPAVARGVGLITASLSRGGRLFFFGAGTSGRLGILEAAECPPTFDTPPGLVRAVMAGGNSSVFRSKEGAEDRGADAEAAVHREVRRGDVVVGIAASGVTAFAGAALSAARARGAKTILVTCNPAARAAADVAIVVDTGPEVVSGSTRLKAGTATKMVLNRLTTLSFVRLGKTFGPYMVDLQPRSRKLVARGERLIALLGGVDAACAAALLREAGGKVKTAVLMARRKLDRRAAEARLKAAGGFLGKALAALLVAAAAQPLHAAKGVRTGLDVLAARKFDLLAGKRVGLIAHAASVDRGGRSIVRLLRRAKGVTLAAIFSPEHGFTGREEAGHKIQDGSAEGVPVRSLYGATLRPTPAMLADIDVLVVDLQDVGTRFYTYITTMGYALEAAKDAGIPFIVLDRPNPVFGDVVEGEVLDPAVRRFTGHFSIPVRHGLTMGEVALWHNRTVGHAGLTVVPMEGWRRDMSWKETRLKFVPPSPNIPSPETAILYTGIGSFESTNVSVGRGTPSPFRLFGAPWMDGAAVAARLAALNLPGLSFTGEAFTPAKPPHVGMPCGGVRVTLTDARAARPVAAFLHAAWILRELYPNDFSPRWDEMPLVTGSRTFQTLYASGAPVEDLLAKAAEDARRFAEERKAVLLYP